MGHEKKQAFMFSKLFRREVLLQVSLSHVCMHVLLFPYQNVKKAKPQLFEYIFRIITQFDTTLSSFQNITCLLLVIIFADKYSEGTFSDPPFDSAKDYINSGEVVL